MIELNWNDFKNFVNTRQLKAHYLTVNSNYHLVAFDYPLEVFCLIPLDNTNSDTIDFETNYKSLWNKKISDSDGYQIVRTRAFTNTDGFRFRGCSFQDDVLTNETKDIDYRLTAERYINGGRLLVSNIGDNDKLTFQVVDKDNVLGYGANAILDEFIKDYFIPTTGNLEVRLDYPARLYAGLYLRLKYTSTHANGCNVKCNLYLHWKTA